MHQYFTDSSPPADREANKWLWSCLHCTEVSKMLKFCAADLVVSFRKSKKSLLSLSSMLHIYFHWRMVTKSGKHDLSILCGKISWCLGNWQESALLFAALWIWFRLSGTILIINSTTAYGRGTQGTVAGSHSHRSTIQSPSYWTSGSRRVTEKNETLESFNTVPCVPRP